MKDKREFFKEALHISVLFSFAVVQPLLEITSRNAEFFVAHNSSTMDIAMLLLFLCVLLPAILILIKAVLGLFSQRLGKWGHYLMVSALASAVALMILKKPLDGTSGIVFLSGAAVSGIVINIAYVRFQHVRNFLAVLSPVILLFPSLFLFNSPVSKVVFSQKNASAVTIEADRAAPVVMIIFDEFNLTSLMNEQREIDPVRYPNFAALSQNSTWFRNATSVSESTEKAVPAILTGKYPTPFSIPVLSDHPGNIFTMLGASYDMKAVESATRLCPEQLCASVREELKSRMAPLLSDISLIYLHVLLPADFASDLPPVTQNWKDFGGGIYKKAGMKKEKGWDWKLVEEALGAKDRSLQARQFINSIVRTERPALYFMHIMLPHAPYIYLPSGKTYNETGFRGIVGGEKWSADEEAIIPDYQRYLLQVGFVDRLLGELIKRLKDVGLYDRSLIVITADHGVSFRPDDFRRPLTKTNFQDIMPVPLLIKSPGQGQGVISDRNVETVDILPTIADILGIRIPWQVDGDSAYDISIPERKNKVIFHNNANEKLTVDSASLESKYATLNKMLSLFGSGAKPGGLFKAGNYSGFVGQSLSPADLELEADTRAEFEMGSFYERIDPESVFLPVQITGRLIKGRGGDVPLSLAVSVNGTIHAVTETFSNKKYEAKFAAIVPETAFRSGRNEVEVFIISGRNGQPRIMRAKNEAASAYWLSAEGEKNKIINSSDGNVIPVAPDAVQGSFALMKAGGGQLDISGWAADIKNFEPADAILVFVNGEFFFKGRPQLHSPGLVNVYGMDSLSWSGYKFLLPFKEGKEGSPEVRVFAVSKRGVASELLPPKPPVTYALSEADKGAGVITTSEGKSIPVIPKALSGHLENVSFGGDSVLVTGWAADIENSEAAEAILIFVNGKFFFSAPCNTERNDVAKRHKSGITRTGFTYRFFVSISEKDVSEARFFAISKRGAASELAYPEGYKWGRRS